MAKLIDLTGRRFGKLTVSEFYGKDHKGRRLWKCICDCGNEKIAYTNALTSGHTRSCGCLYPKAENLEGKKFGMLTVLERVEDTFDKSDRRYVTWKCRCDCGNITYVTANNLHGKTTSCGCLLKSVAGKQTLKHGYRKTRLYSIYNGMKQRCNNPNHIEYKSYGGRGISVCDEWNVPDGLAAFAEWALLNGYTEELTIERIDVNGNYEPKNCTWIPLSEQAKNTTRNRFVTYKGKKLILKDFARITGIDHRKIGRYLDKGFSVDEILEMENAHEDSSG